VGAPILSPEGTAIAALSVTAPVHNWKVEQLSTIVREAATIVSGALHGSLD
jgi:DNA-binding IclR family transcriptional regulator